MTRRLSGPSCEVRPGDVIWIVGQVDSPWGRLPPAIDARIVVARVTRRPDGVRRFAAAPASEWFPLYQATQLFGQLRTIDSKGRIARLRADRDTPVGQSLQSMREVANPELLELHRRKTQRQPLNFISYRIADGTKQAFRTASRLVSKGQAVYWDRWCLPRRLAERREVVSSTALDSHLMDMLKAAEVVWGIESPLYGEGSSYSGKEKSAALSRKTYKPVRVVIGT